MFGDGTVSSLEIAERNCILVVGSLVRLKGVYLRKIDEGDEPSRWDGGWN